MTSPLHIPPDDEGLESEAAALRARVEVLEEALRPFGALVEYVNDGQPDEQLLTVRISDPWPGRRAEFTVGDLRAAARALEGEQG